MADPAETEPEVEEQPPPKKDWRKELEDRATAAEQAQVEMATELAIFKAGLGHLTDDQRDDVLTLAKSKGQTGADDLKAIAQRLSYVQLAEPAPTESAPAQNEDIAKLDNFGRGGQASEPPPSAKAVFEDQVRNFKGSQVEYEKFLRDNAEFLAP